MLWASSKHSALGTWTEEGISSPCGQEVVCQWDRVVTGEFFYHHLLGLATSMGWVFKKGDHGVRLPQEFPALSARMSSRPGLAGTRGWAWLYARWVRGFPFWSLVPWISRMENSSRYVRGCPGAETKKARNSLGIHWAKMSGMEGRNRD